MRRTDGRGWGGVNPLEQSMQRRGEKDQSLQRGTKKAKRGVPQDAGARIVRGVRGDLYFVVDLPPPSLTLHSSSRNECN